MKVIVYHSGYGCETGCCGHRIEMGDGPVERGWGGLETVTREKFTFSHPWNEDKRAWAQDLVRKEFGPEHVADLDWDNSLILDD